MCELKGILHSLFLIRRKFNTLRTIRYHYASLALVGDLPNPFVSWVFADAFVHQSWPHHRHHRYNWGYYKIWILSLSQARLSLSLELPWQITVHALFWHQSSAFKTFAGGKFFGWSYYIADRICICKRWKMLAKLVVTTILILVVRLMEDKSRIVVRVMGDKSRCDFIKIKSYPLHIRQ